MGVTVRSRPEALSFNLINLIMQKTFLSCVLLFLSLSGVAQGYAEAYRVMDSLVSKSSVISPSQEVEGYSLFQYVYNESILDEHITRDGSSYCNSYIDLRSSGPTAISIVSHTYSGFKERDVVWLTYGDIVIPGIVEKTGVVSSDSDSDRPDIYSTVITYYGEVIYSSWLQTSRKTGALSTEGSATLSIKEEGSSSLVPIITLPTSSKAGILHTHRLVVNYYRAM